MSEVPYNQAHDVAHETALWGWWISAGLVGLLISAHVIDIVKRRRLPPQESPPSVSRLDQVRRIPTAIWAGWHRISTYTVPIYLFRSPSVGELIWTIGYITTLAALTLHGSYHNGVWNYQDAMGYMSSSQIPLIIGLAGKNNVISYLTGVSYERLNFLHRVSGRMAVLWAWIHAIGRIQLGLQPPDTMGSAHISAGILALVAITVVEFSSERPIRKRWYETFIILHIIFVLAFIIGCWIHHPEVAYWVYSGLMLWSLDRLASLARLIRCNQLVARLLRGPSVVQQATIELLNSDILRFTVRDQVMSWNPGQHAYISCPALGRSWLEQHPFSIVNIPADGQSSQDVVFLCRVHNGFTMRVRDSLLSDKRSASVLVEGPYGSPPRLHTYNTVILVAGGVGITWCTSRFLGLLSAMRNKPTPTRCLRLVWSTRDGGDVEWIQPFLKKALTEAERDNLDVHFDVYLTQSSRADDPNEDDEECDLESTGGAATSEIVLNDGKPPSRTPPLGAGLSRSIPHFGSFGRRSSHVGVSCPKENFCQAENDHTAQKNEYILPLPEIPRIIDKGFLAAEEAPSTNLPTESPMSPSYYLPPITYHLNEPQLDPATEKTLASHFSPLETLPRPPGLGVHQGRADIRTIVSENVGRATGPINISVCGPSLLAAEVRRAAISQMEVTKVLGGERHSVHLHCENFAW